jgi:hypothetical protein
MNSSSSSQEGWDHELALEIHRREQQQEAAVITQPAAGAWDVVKRKKGKKKAAAVEANVDSETQTATFLKSYKTRKCKIKDKHNHADCFDYHSSGDCRRDPYKTPYDERDSRTKQEQMFHPIVFRTQECKRGKQCPHKSPKFCAFAHSQEELRSQQDERERYQKRFLDPMVVQPPSRTLELFCGPSSFESTERHQPTQQFIFDWGVSAPIAYSCFQIEVPLSPWQKRVYATSKGLQKNIADKICPCRLIHNDAIDKFGCPLKVMVMGNEPAIYEAYGVCLEMLENPGEVKQETRPYAPDVILKIQKYLKHFSSKLPTVNMEVDLKTNTVTVKEICAGRKTSAKNIAAVFDRITIWQQVEADQYDKTFECCCCYEMFAFTEGIACSKGHFFCAGACLGNMVENQLPSIQSQNGELFCAVCRNILSMQNIARVAPEEVYEKLQCAITDFRVGKQTQRLEQEMHERFKEKIAEIEGKYRSGGNQGLKMKAEGHAKCIRNDILNLACPHCKVVYFDFEGCMALQCTACKRFFCGYCHAQCTTSRGCHDHVRECDLNETMDGSYYATPEQMKTGQRRYRTKTLKQFLRKLKKDEQDATIIELESDLEDHGISKAVLFQIAAGEEDVNRLDRLRPQ